MENRLTVCKGKLVETLLRSPTFHRGVQRVHKHVDELRHGKAPVGGTSLEEPSGRSIKDLARMFVEELKSGHQSRPPKQ